MKRGIQEPSSTLAKAKLRWLVIPAMLSAVSGCFTEVGNAEDDQLVKADFRIDYSLSAQPLAKASHLSAQPESVSISRMYMVVREAEYHNTDGSERYLWSEDSLGMAVDFTQADSEAMLPPQKIALETIANFKLELTIPVRRKLRADTLDLTSFKDRNYLAGTYRFGEEVRPFLFALPTGTLHLIYSQEVMASWLRGKEYHCQFTFFGGQWLAGARLDTALAVRDRLRRPFILLDTNSNAAIYRRLADRFYQSFNTRNAFLRVVEDVTPRY